MTVTFYTILCWGKGSNDKRRICNDHHYVSCRSCRLQQKVTHLVGSSSSENAALGIDNLLRIVNVSLFFLLVITP